jgi:superfamily II DNA or RNA helicase
MYIDKSLLGTITAGKVNIGAGMTFATVQTLAKQDLSQYKYTWDVIIVDECHRVAGTPTAMTQFSKVINSLACRHKYGLSATVHRADGMIKCTHMLLGDVKHIVPDEKVKDKVMAVSVKRIDTNEGIQMDALDTDGTINYTRLISKLAEKTNRNMCILSHLVDEPEHYHLILSDRLAQLNMIYDMLPEDLKEKACIIDGTMTSKKGKQQREQAIEDMRTGKKHFLFASYKLAKEGLDIPRLDRLHMATPQKDYAIIVQSVGRIARTFLGKEQPVCFDYVDNFKMAENMYKARCRHYRKCGCVLND